MTTDLHLLTDALLQTLGRCSRQDYLRQMLRDCDMNAAALLRTGHERPYPVVWPEHGLALQVQPMALPLETAAPEAAAVTTVSDAASEASPEQAARAAAFAAALEKHLGPAAPTKSAALHHSPTADSQNNNPDTVPEGYFWGLHSATFDAAHWPGPWPGGLNPETATLDDWFKALPGDPKARTEILRTPELGCLTLAGPDGQTWSAVVLFDSGAAKLQSLTFARVGDWIAASTLPPWPKADQPSQ